MTHASDGGACGLDVEYKTREGSNDTYSLLLFLYTGCLVNHEVGSEDYGVEVSTSIHTKAEASGSTGTMIKSSYIGEQYTSSSRVSDCSPRSTDVQIKEVRDDE
ncbi:hypothetical protein AcW1_006100 [Taiwanofungus camphoratus]|nr:hypothetical protein AcV7_008648 [Antrodia cinnamomea]KAI0957837.1 hypothetical protein AcW1_006100 [Antrodia cinnamomea]